MASVTESDKELMNSNQLILKLHQRFRYKKHNLFAEEMNQIALSDNDEERIQSIDSIETCIWNGQKSSM